MKKVITLFLCILGFSLSTFSQDEAPVEIETRVVKVSDTEYDLVFEVFIDENWHLYSQYNPEDASLPMSIKPAEGEKGFTLVGKAKESETHTEFSDIWGVDEIFFVEEAVITQRIKLDDPTLRQVTLNMDAQVCKTFCLPYDEDFTFSLDGGAVVATVAEVDEKSQAMSNSLKLDLKNTDLLEGNKPTGNDDEKQANLLQIFLLGFAGGLLAFLTPCVFPLIPLTVSFFTKQAKTRGKGVRNALLYGFFIAAIYLLLSAPFHYMDSLDPEILNTISTNIWLNLFFFIVLVFFAGSFFGFYTITLPSSWGTKIDSASDIGGLIGIFFMALTLAIVSFSCTGPILGSLLAGSLTSDGGAMQLTAGMGGFGVALALPFAFFALFPNLLSSLPKSGSWMNMITVMLGFIELAMAFKFLSNADLVGHWNVFKREIFIGIWILIALLSALFLFGRLVFPGGARIRRVAGFRVLLGLLMLGFAVYLAPGVTKKPIWNQNLLSGFAPPQFYSVYKQDNNCPLALTCFKDFDEGMAYAKSVNKPVLLDFTGWACVNCRKMEENVWSQADIYRTLKDKYVLISLYVDDNENKLPADKQFDFVKPNGRVKKIKTYGDKWTTLQTVNFKNASQPYYVLMSPDLEVLNSPQQYTDKSTYYDWLKEGLQNYQKYGSN
ncbi:protein-disulfide reductase DsbD family protein [Tenacibaculum sp. IB213877]|uniref:protein-disulfide reductase DsbD family protein n=1 Tax=Tenacibaculum sp. IB213877 TaxID=3097351 RepID=UPI002A5A8646|nr:cytochrome c biogenesis protein CcdA [Tenacibaculum sp. IB213877]MDY0780800.1 cytochrome c biogenesis protein CcdA [Tenacibaculum sp. IB213877]